MGPLHGTRPSCGELAELVRVAVADAASSGDVELASFVSLLGEAQPPDEKLARRFCDEALDLLDDVAWVPVEAEASAPSLAKPTDVLVDEDSLIVEKLRDTFPPAYVLKQTGLAIPSSSIGSRVIGFLCRDGARTRSPFGTSSASSAAPVPTGRGPRARRRSGSSP